MSRPLVTLAEPSRSEPEEAPPESPRGRILVIDDDPVVPELFQKVLSSDGHNVDIALSGSDGLKMFKRVNAYDLVITDLHLGDASGLDVLKVIKEFSPRTEVIILTGYASTESATEALRLGADDYLVKPVRQVELLKTVRQRLAAQQLQDRVDELNRRVAEERDKLRRSVAELSILKAMAERMMQVMSYVGGFEVVLKVLVDEVSADAAVIYDLHQRSARLSARHSLSRDDLVWLSESIRNHSRRLLGYEVECAPNNFEGLPASAAPTPGTPFQSAAATPILQGDQPMGLLLAASRFNPDFESDWGEFLSQLSVSASRFLTGIRSWADRQRHFTASVVEHTLDGIIVLSPQTGDALINQAARKMLDLPPDAGLEVDTLLNLLEFDLDAFKAKSGGAAPEVVTRSLERTVQDRRAFLQVTASRLPASGEDGEMVLFVLHDVTRERAVEEMKNRLISNLTHEVRTPTAVIKEFMALILDGVSGELTPTQRQYLQVMHSNVERLSRLIDNLLTLARSETGGFAVVLQPTELRPLVLNVANSMDVKLRRKRINLNVTLPPELPLIYADPDAVTQVLTNLVDNAYKYSPEDTEVGISAEVRGNRVVIAVADQGYGIPRDRFDDIFKRFHRLVDENDPRFQEGVGLGLALVKDLVTRHGGEVWLESELGKGSTFYVSFLIAAEDAVHSPA